MKRSDVYEIAVKLFGMYLVIPVIYYFGTMISLLSSFFSAHYYEQVSGPVWYGSIITFSLLVTVMLLLVFKTKRVVRLITTDSDHADDVKLFTSKNTIYEIALFVIGGIMFAWSLPDVCLSIYNYFHYNKQGINWSPNQSQALTMQILKLIVGIFIVLSAELVSNFFSKEKKIHPADT